MRIVIRHAISIVLLPGVVLGFVPIWIARRYGIEPGAASDLAGVAIQVIGGLLLGVGVVLFVWSLAHFARRGRGTLAPWDPPSQLVITGPYRFVRNPMISGVIFCLLGEAALLRSSPHLAWAIAFLVLNAVYIPLLEEPRLELRFGDEYRRYCRHVSRLVPRRRPWRPDAAVEPTERG